MRDASESMQVEDERDASDALYRQVAEHASDVVYTTDDDYRFNWISPSVVDVLGWTPVELIGTSASSLQADPDVDLTASIRSQVFGEQRVLEARAVRYRTRSGSYRWMSVRAHPVTGAVDGAISTVVTMSDCDAEVLQRKARETLSSGRALLGVAEAESAVQAAMCDTAVGVGGYRFAW